MSYDVRGSESDGMVGCCADGVVVADGSVKWAYDVVEYSWVYGDAYDVVGGMDSAVSSDGADAIE